MLIEALLIPISYVLKCVKTLLLLLLLFFNILFVDAQNSSVDSVVQVLQKHTGDSTEVKALTWLGKFTSQNDPPASLRYFRKGLQLAESLQDAKRSTALYNELGYLYHTQGNYDSSLFFHRRALARALANNNAYESAEAYEGIALNFLRLTQLDSTRHNLEKGLSVAIRSNDYASQSDLYNLWGNVFLEEGNDAEALKKFIYSAKLQDSLVHDPVNQSRALLNIANIQSRQGNADKALDYAREAQVLAEKGKFDQGLAYASQLIGRIYRKQKKLDEALAEYKKALSLYERMGVRRSLAETFQNIGNIYYDKGDFKEARNQYSAALQNAKSISNQTLIAHSHASLSYAFYELKQFEKAIAYADSAHRAAKKINSPYTVMEAYLMLSNAHREQQHYREALAYFQQYTTLKDSLSEASSKADIAELEMKYQNEKKVTEIELLKSEQALSSSRQRANLMLVAIALISVIIISALLVNRYRVINRTKRQAELDRVRNTIARDLHDDLGSALSSINILSQVALYEKNGNAQNYFQRIGDQSARMMEYMGDMVWSINPRNDSMDQVIIRMREFATEIFESKNIEYQFSEEVAGELTLDADKRKNLFLIFKESVNNAAKYSNARRVEISLRQQDHALVMSIKDYGQGFDEQTIKTGNGLRNLRERATEMNGTVTLKSVVGEGTEVALFLPLA
jgi:two-component system sensor histidine kinase UhpB